MPRAYATPFYLTFRQAKKLGGCVRKGEHGHLVVFWKWTEYEDKDTGQKKNIPFLRYYRVFNLSQVDGIPEDKIPTLEQRQNDPIAECDRIVNEMPHPPAMVTGDRACYTPAFDTVTMPGRQYFRDSESYYSVLFHELTHSTGHESRLDRHKDQADHHFGSKDYSKEELVAEMGAAYLCGQAGIDPQIESSAAYIKSWLRALRNDIKMVVMAAAKAQKAADYILDATAPATVEG